MRLQKIAMTKKSSIFDEFLHDREFAGSFYQYHPWQEESIYERARDLKTFETGRFRVRNWSGCSGLTISRICCIPKWSEI